GSVVSDNLIFNNGVGIVANSGGLTIQNNRIHSNDIGLRGDTWFGGLVENNLLYANTNVGIRIAANGSGNTTPKQFINNTIYQPVGDAIRLESNTRTARFYNNIIWVETGFGFNVFADSTAGFDSDWNLFNLGLDPNARIGRFAGDDAFDFGAWRTLTGHDANSLFGDPLFVDINGADNLLGYTAAGIHGGDDDNFTLRAGSPAIDRGNAWLAPDTDILGNSRLDDPGTPNSGTPDYLETLLGESLFDSASGQAMNWRSSNASWTLNLPFDFPFHDSIHSQVFVGSNGLLQFGNATGLADMNNTTEKLGQRARIAPMWDALRTNGAGNDIFVDTSVAGQVTIRYNATHNVTGQNVQFAVVLFADGRIRFDYGPGNTGLSPTIGVSRGDQRFVTLSIYNDVTTLTHANSVELALTPGMTFTDIGAYEFMGSSLDTQPPTVINVLPEAIWDQGLLGTNISQIVIQFSEEMNPIDANAPSSYRLTWAGPDGILDTGDDQVLAVQPLYVIGDDFATLTILSGDLQTGLHRLTVRGNNRMHDLAGNSLDGNNDGQSGGDFNRTFEVSGHGAIVTPLTPLISQEGGADARFAVSLSRQPAADVLMPVVSSHPDVAGPLVDQLLFTPDNWDVPREVIIRSIEDDIARGTVNYVIQFGPTQSLDPMYDQAHERAFNLVHQDNDAAGFALLDAQNLTTTRSGGAAQFAMHLTSQPLADVIVLVGSSDPEQGTVTPEELLFTTDNWDQAQTLSIQGMPGGEVPGDQSYLIIIGPAISDDPVYSGLTGPSVAVVNLDDVVIESRIIARHIFLNNSVLDGFDPAASNADDPAILPDKQVLPPGQTADGANLTGYVQGINGIMIDLAGAPELAGISAADFTFFQGADEDFEAWIAAPAPTIIDVRPGEGIDGSDRITLIWTDGTIVDTWLQVTVLNTEVTRLPEPDVFYFGNLRGDTDGNGAVNNVDLLRITINMRKAEDDPTIDPATDLTGDGLVTIADREVVRDHYHNVLPMITAPNVESAHGMALPIGIPETESGPDESAGGSDDSFEGIMVWPRGPVLGSVGEFMPGAGIGSAGVDYPVMGPMPAGNEEAGDLMEFHEAVAEPVLPAAMVDDGDRDPMADKRGGKPSSIAPARVMGQVPPIVRPVVVPAFSLLGTPARIPGVPGVPGVAGGPGVGMDDENDDSLQWLSGEAAVGPLNLWDVE
ncbi:MAG: right-handed parallel beta-helix repeat-containing protein, partial [Phycisphaeraceae bacterium]|nr:right-handed parallel beta-helix repeat-containing protein [Phycisphaeraceae bacterium]